MRHAPCDELQRGFVTRVGGSAIMAKYGKKAKSEVKRAVKRTKKGTQKSGKSGKIVKSRKQAIAIGLSKARKKGAKVPKKKKTSSKKSSKKKSSKKSSKKRSTKK